MGRTSLPVVVALSVLLGGLGTARAQQRSMTAVDLLEVPSLSDPRLSPDGRHVVYVLAEAAWKQNKRVGHIWWADTRNRDRRQLTAGESGESEPRWSPDGKTLAFLAERGDDEIAQIYLLPIEGGEARRLGSHPTGPGSLEWAADGRHILFLADDEPGEAEKNRATLRDDVFAFEENYRQQHLWRISVASGEASRVTTGDFSVIDYRPSHDGAKIAHHRAPTPLIDDGDEGEVWLMDADGSSAVRLTDNAFPEVGAELSPDGSQVMYLAASDGREYYFNSNLFLVPAAGGEATVVAADSPWEIRDAHWRADGAGIVVHANSGVRSALYNLDPESGELSAMTLGDQSLGAWHYAATADRHAVSVTEAANAGDVWMVMPEGGARRITRVFDYLARDFQLPAVEVVTWAGSDGVEIEGLLWLPLGHEDGRRAPLVVQTHGGPRLSDKFAFGRWSNYPQLLTARGWVVLQPNYRGSTGYGDDFLRDMVGHYFRNAHLDVMAGVDALIERGVVDGERMVKMGWSGGGHMTNKIITHTDRFKAASSGAGASNWVSMYAQSDTRIQRTPWFGGDPWQEGAPIDVYWQHSPLREAWKVTTPTLFLVGENDARVPAPQSVEMFRALEANGVPTKLYVAPREGHGWRELRHQLFKINVELDWFESRVRDREYVWESAPTGEAEERPIEAEVTGLGGGP